MTKFLFKQEDIEIELEDESRYFADLEKDVCLQLLQKISMSIIYY
jgi:hypothetical protein